MSLLRCPFLARQPMSVLRSKSTHLMNFARNCPVMSRVLNSLHPASQLHTSGVKPAVSGSEDGGATFDKCPFLVDSGLKIQKPNEKVLQDIVVAKADQGIFQVSERKPAASQEGAKKCPFSPEPVTADSKDVPKQPMPANSLSPRLAQNNSPKAIVFVVGSQDALSLNKMANLIWLKTQKIRD
ncbi:5-aminolevulinate synthase, nonspecific, mitochondrial-like [Paramuricea clavata]|uniref:5-aminolevulinate synthase, nonspecific, mitochondrial-like n=1 Tax=Paramuricea clavata TaxID=317549 RepID=A0A6S7J0Z3_PARCT|nr:5-aminolevulinate synthase, nonspecific, mitochondrial-like [Paramuricea clavata]